MSLDPNGTYILDKLYEDNQVTLYTDFTWDFRQDQELPETRPAYVQDVVTGKRRVFMPRLRPRSASQLPLTQTSLQRISNRRKQSSRHRMAALRQRQRQNLISVSQQVESEMIAGVPTRYGFMVVSVVNNA